MTNPSTPSKRIRSLPFSENLHLFLLFNKKKSEIGS